MPEETKTEEFRIDNRGSAETPFGYVYVDDTRVGFADSAVWFTNGWHADENQLERVADHLTEHFGYGWYPEEY
jgi:hypothetical protein